MLASLSLHAVHWCVTQGQSWLEAACAGGWMECLHTPTDDPCIPFRRISSIIEGARVIKGVYPQPCCDVVGESLAQVAPKLSYFHLWSCLEIQSLQGDEGSSKYLGSHSGILAWPPGIILSCGTSHSSTGLPGRSVCALWF